MTKKEMQYRIDYEITVDCYDEREVNLGWFTFLEDELSFPFEAEVVMKTRKGIKQLVKVDVLGIVEDNDFEQLGVHFEISPKGSNMVSEVHISRLKT